MVRVMEVKADTHPHPPPKRSRHWRTSGLLSSHIGGLALFSTLRSRISSASMNSSIQLVGALYVLARRVWNRAAAGLADQVRPSHSKKG